MCCMLLVMGGAAIQAGVSMGENTAESGLLESLRLIGYALEADGMAELLQGAFQCAWPGFGADFARAITFTRDAQVGRACFKVHPS